MRWIGGQVKAGRWGPGDVLPGERGLAEEIGVARGTLRGALGRLERAGLLVRCGTDGRSRRFALRPPGPGKRGSGTGPPESQKSLECPKPLESLECPTHPQLPQAPPRNRGTRAMATGRGPRAERGGRPAVA